MKLDSAQVKVPPPLILVVSIVIGAAMDHIYPVGLQVHLRPLGYLFLIAGVLVAFFCITMFRKAKTDVRPWQPTTAIVERGVYRWSRNPIYLSFVLINAGVGLALDTVWNFVTMVPLFIFLNNYVIRKEEKYLEQKFGQSYLIYKARVRRWI